MAYQPNGMAVQFHQVWTNAALSRFVQSLINPIQRMVGPGDLMSFMTGKDVRIHELSLSLLMCYMVKHF